MHASHSANAEARLLGVLQAAIEVPGSTFIYPTDAYKYTPTGILLTRHTDATHQAPSFVRHLFLIELSGASMRHDEDSVVPFVHILEAQPRMSGVLKLLI